MNINNIIETIFKKLKCNFYCGVPDSTLKNITSNFKNSIITANEGSAIALASGYYLSQKKTPVVYLQNSGLGNAINPLASISHKKVYSIPMVLLIGWRGSPNSKDEPQHKVKGDITLKLLDLLNINHSVIEKNINIQKLTSKINKTIKQKKIYALLVPFKNKKNLTKETKKNYQFQDLINKSKLYRSTFLLKLLESLKQNDKLISTTGYTSREVFQIRKNYKINNGQDFYMVGGMGHTSMVAFGSALFSRNRIICVDGDGSLIMHLGSMTNIGVSKIKNFKYFLLNNQSHESVGGQPTLSKNINFKTMSKSLGFKHYECIKNKKDLKKIETILKNRKLVFVEVKISIGSIPNLLRPKNLLSIKKKFMRNFR
jgi:phosphonopyruvate decarboxylase